MRRWMWHWIRCTARLSDIRVSGNAACGGRFAESELELEAVEPVPIEPMDEEEEKVAIVRRKQVSLIPMSEDEAIDQMELLGHNFFIFYNAETAKIGVLYRREDGNYGVLEPEVAITFERC